MASFFEQHARSAGFAAARTADVEGELHNINNTPVQLTSTKIPSPPRPCSTYKDFLVFSDEQLSDPDERQDLADALHAHHQKTAGGRKFLYVHAPDYRTNVRTDLTDGIPSSASDTNFCLLQQNVRAGVHRCSRVLLWIRGTTVERFSSFRSSNFGSLHINVPPSVQSLIQLLNDKFLVTKDDTGQLKIRCELSDSGFPKWVTEEVYQGEGFLTPDNNENPIGEFHLRVSEDVGQENYSDNVGVFGKGRESVSLSSQTKPVNREISISLQSKSDVLASGIDDSFASAVKKKRNKEHSNAFLHPPINSVSNDVLCNRLKDNPPIETSKFSEGKNSLPSIHPSDPGRCTSRLPVFGQSRGQIIEEVHCPPCLTPDSDIFEYIKPYCVPRETKVDVLVHLGCICPYRQSHSLIISLVNLRFLLCPSSHHSIENLEEKKETFFSPVLSSVGSPPIFSQTTIPPPPPHRRRRSSSGDIPTRSLSSSESPHWAQNQMLSRPLNYITQDSVSSSLRHSYWEDLYDGSQSLIAKRHSQSKSEVAEKNLNHSKMILDSQRSLGGHYSVYGGRVSHGVENMYSPSYPLERDSSNQNSWPIAGLSDRHRRAHSATEFDTEISSSIGTQNDPRSDRPISASRSYSFAPSSTNCHSSLDVVDEVRRQHGSLMYLLRQRYLLQNHPEETKAQSNKRIGRNGVAENFPNGCQNDHLSYHHPSDSPSYDTQIVHHSSALYYQQSTVGANIPSNSEIMTSSSVLSRQRKNSWESLPHMHPHNVKQRMNRLTIMRSPNLNDGVVVANKRQHTSSSDTTKPTPVSHKQHITEDSLYSIGDLVEIVKVGGRKDLHEGQRGEIVSIGLSSSDVNLHLCRADGRRQRLQHSAIKENIPISNIRLFEKAEDRIDQFQKLLPIDSSLSEFTSSTDTMYSPPHQLVGTPFSLFPPRTPTGVLCFFWDLEATGLDVMEDDVTQIACICRRFHFGSSLGGCWEVVDGFPEREFNRYIYTDRMVPKPVVELTGITNEFLDEHGASFYQALMDWKEWIQSITIRVESQECPIWFVAHNGNRYDIPLLFQQEAKLGQPPGTFFESVGTVGIVDSVILSRRLQWGDGPKRSHKLQSLYSDTFHVQMPNEHDALGDVTGLAALMGEEPFLSAWKNETVGWTLLQYIADFRFSSFGIRSTSYPLNEDHYFSHAMKLDRNRLTGRATSDSIGSNCDYYPFSYHDQRYYTPSTDNNNKPVQNSLFGTTTQEIRTSSIGPPTFPIPSSSSPSKRLPLFYGSVSRTASSEVSPSLYAIPFPEFRSSERQEMTTEENSPDFVGYLEKKRLFESSSLELSVHRDRMMVESLNDDAGSRSQQFSRLNEGNPFYHIRYDLCVSSDSECTSAPPPPPYSSAVSPLMFFSQTTDRFTRISSDKETSTPSIFPAVVETTFRAKPGDLPPSLPCPGRLTTSSFQQQKYEATSPLMMARQFRPVLDTIRMDEQSEISDEFRRREEDDHPSSSSLGSPSVIPSIWSRGPWKPKESPSLIQRTRKAWGGKPSASSFSNDRSSSVDKTSSVDKLMDEDNRKVKKIMKRSPVLSPPLDVRMVRKGRSPEWRAESEPNYTQQQQSKPRSSITTPQHLPSSCQRGGRSSEGLQKGEGPHEGFSLYGEAYREEELKSKHSDQYDDTVKARIGPHPIKQHVKILKRSEVDGKSDGKMHLAAAIAGLSYDVASETYKQSDKSSSMWKP